ncbi:undecaprenyl-diphosphate phosphatase [Candidatus Galacturonibacter soehngenii]|uniref:Undecaprenyl-diphosphatase n=1 Tax=Candidatus Galacturonatibacter soehngenii TaxID=2307010 RepID=A0A7V7UD07_9FIRM|nr:undecaprenyl-diphosphate phosphatase [Candidatus Galacturonibacter soehngenii]KAB1439821.1 undecaprenyl-diphosphate phosphatase [Candidatus Galacturonibacter soehngenii]MBA4685943.1 undecaprenyl-diphosphate phosphatase [Candidatus Galacturonibacter soehngenii]
MSLLQAILMGIIQGITEFLPVSSSGHLAIFKELFQIDLETGILFDIMLHLGTLLAVFIVYFKDIKRLVIESFAILYDCILNLKIFISNIIHKNNEGYRPLVRNAYRKFVILVIFSTIPTAIIGYAAKDLIEVVSKILIVPGVCLIITGILLFIADKYNDGTKTPKQVSYNNAFIIGICQGIATLPGISRSGTTITACLVSGFDKKFAVKYSFIMSIPAILGAAVLELKDITTMNVTPSEIINYVVGAVVAALVGYICIKTMLVVVRRKKFKFFAIYCLLAGTLASVGYFVIS